MRQTFVFCECGRSVCLQILEYRASQAREDCTAGSLKRGWGARKAIQSFRLRLHSGLRQSGPTHVAPRHEWGTRGSGLIFMCGPPRHPFGGGFGQMWAPVHSLGNPSFFTLYLDPCDSDSKKSRSAIDHLSGCERLSALAFLSILESHLLIFPDSTPFDSQRFERSILRLRLGYQ